ncbi:MAG: hypothetical protein HUU50_14485 [Candidatus Brocadiae bacterium]|nr:hypothetical protein [Candidatus Brocadiia bacterium]
MRIIPFDFTGFQDCYSSARLRFDQDSAKIMSDDMQFHQKALSPPKPNASAIPASSLNTPFFSFLFPKSTLFA